MADCDWLEGLEELTRDVAGVRNLCNVLVRAYGLTHERFDNLIREHEALCSCMRDVVHHVVAALCMSGILPIHVSNEATSILARLGTLGKSKVHCDFEDIIGAQHFSYCAEPGRAGPAASPKKTKQSKAGPAASQETTSKLVQPQIPEPEKAGPAASPKKISEPVLPQTPEPRSFAPSASPQEISQPTCTAERTCPIIAAQMTRAQLAMPEFFAPVGPGDASTGPGEPKADFPLVIVGKTARRRGAFTPKLGAFSKILPSAATPSQQLVMVGGHNGQRVLGSVEAFDVKEGRWEWLSPMCCPRMLPCMAVVGRWLYVAGGTDQMGNYPRSTERFDLEHGSWEEVLPVKVGRFGAATAVLKGQLYVCGGLVGATVLSSMERFDTGVDQWETCAPMQLSRFRFVFAAVEDCLYACGGCSQPANSEESLADTLGQKVLAYTGRYCPTLNTWSVLPDMHTARVNAAAVVYGSSLYVAGGNDAKHYLASAECLDTDDERWRSLPRLNRGRCGAAAIVDGRGHIYLCGGLPASHVEHFDPEGCVWETVAELSQPRSSPALLIVAGQLYVCGGCLRTEASQVVECIDVETGTNVLLPPMQNSRAEHLGVVRW